MSILLIGADICPIEGNRPYFKRGDAQALFNDLLDEFELADLVLANLECPLIESQTPIEKTGPVFGVESACINGVKNAGIDVLALANNHIFDHGTPGLTNTLEVCRKAGISTVGAGTNLAEAGKILVRNLDGLRVGILAMAEREFSIATTASAGANPFSAMEYVRTVKRESGNFDYLLVLLHGGHEFHCPTPHLKDTCHFLVEMGADAVIVQHPHCLGGYERYLDAHIVYGQGALVMDEGIYRDRLSFHEGFLVKLTIAPDFTSTMDFVPFVQSRPVPGARRLTGENEQRLREHLAERAALIRDDNALQREWLTFLRLRQHAYLSSLFGHNRIMRKINSRGLITRFLYDNKSLLRSRNILTCDTHREAVESILTSLAGTASHKHSSNGP